MCDNLNVPTSSHFLIRSIDREEYYSSSPSSFRVQLSKPLRGNKAQIAFAQLGNTYYNITNKNNAIKYNNVLYTVPEGCYSLNELMSTIGSLLTLTVSFDSIVGRMTIQSGVIFTLDLTIDNSICKKIGFLPQVYAAALSYTGSYVPKLYDNSIYIQTNFCAHIQTTSPKKNVSFVIPHTGNKGDIIFFYASSQFSLQPIIKDQTIGILEINVLDEDGDILKNLAEWQMMIQIV